MTADITFQPPVGLAPVVGFQPPVRVAPSVGFQAPVAVAPDLGVTRSGRFQTTLGLSTQTIDFNSLQRLESVSLLNRSVESLDALRLRMSEQFCATASETWRPSSDPLRSPGLAI